MRRDLFDKGGFDPRLPSRERRRQRTVLSLLAGLALAVSIIVAVTAVSIGIAHAEILVAGQIGDGSLAVVYIACSLIAGAIIGAIYRRREPGPP